MNNFYVTPTLIDSFLFWEENGFPENKFKEIIDKINKVPTQQSENAIRGVAFESCINLTLSGHFTNEFDGLTFNPELVEKVSKKLNDQTGIQVWLERIVDFQHGKFKVGGLANYTKNEIIVDLKTTTNYRLGKYRGYSQHKAFGLIDPSKKGFAYYCTDFENLYVEPYKNKQEYHDEFISNVERFWLFCKENEGLITDTKIWGNV